MLTKIGKRIKNIRELKGITQEQLAEKTNLSLTSISRLENGKSMVSIEKLLNIANALDTDLGVILCDYMTTSAALTDNEAELVSKFRQLTTEKQKSTIAFIDVIYHNF